MSDLRGYHAHVYFDAANKDAARLICEGARDRFGVEMGRMHDRPVGPHPMGSCQLAFGPEKLGEVLPWLAMNRGELTVFTHLDTGDDLTDHTQHTIWMGRQQDLNLSIFGV